MDTVEETGSSTSVWNPAAMKHILVSIAAYVELIGIAGFHYACFTTAMWCDLGNGVAFLWYF